MKDNHKILTSDDGRLYYDWHHKVKGKLVYRRVYVYKYTCPTCKEDGYSSRPDTIYCGNHCAKLGILNPNWKDGKKYQDGYLLLLQKNNKYKLEHRLIMEKHLGRPLLKNEHIHHQK